MVITTSRSSVGGTKTVMPSGSPAAPVTWKVCPSTTLVCVPSVADMRGRGGGVGVGAGVGVGVSSGAASTAASRSTATL